MMGLGDGGPKPKQLMWLVIAGMEAPNDTNQPPVGLTELGLTPDSRLIDVFAVALQRQHSPISAFAEQRQAYREDTCARLNPTSGGRDAPVALPSCARRIPKRGPSNHSDTSSCRRSS